MLALRLILKMENNSVLKSRPRYHQTVLTGRHLHSPPDNLLTSQYIMYRVTEGER